MLLRDGEDYLELTPTPDPEAGGIRAEVRIRVRGMNTLFTAETSCWIDSRAMAEFADQLRVLEKRRKGVAALKSMSPGELLLEIRSTDRSGHMAAFGQVGHWFCSQPGNPYWSAVVFSIPFCPSELEALVGEFAALAFNPTA